MTKMADLVVERSISGDLTRASFLSRARRVIAVALTKGNANLVRASLGRSMIRPMRFGGADRGSVGGSASHILAAAAAASALSVSGGAGAGRARL